MKFVFYVLWRVLKLALFMLALPFLVALALPALFTIAIADECVQWWVRVRRDWGQR